MPIIAKNIRVISGEKKLPTSDKKESIEKVTPEEQKPKYLSLEHGELTKKINTKSQYMRDIFDLDS